MLDLHLFRGAGLRRRADRGVRDLRVDLRGLPLPDALPAERARLLAAPGGAPLPAVVAGRVRRRGDLRQPHLARAGPLADGRRARDHRRLAAADGARRHRTRAGRSCCRDSCSAGSGSGSRTRRSPRPPWASSRPSGRAWPPARTAPSARSGSRPASPASGRSSSTRSPSKLTTPERGGARATTSSRPWRRAPSRAAIAPAGAGRVRRLARLDPHDRRDRRLRRGRARVVLLRNVRPPHAGAPAG